MSDLIDREEVRQTLYAYIPGFRWKTIDKIVDDIPSAQPERLTDDDFETIRIHLNAYKENLCNQRRWEEAEEYQRIIDRFMAFASAQSEPQWSGLWSESEDEASIYGEKLMEGDTIYLLGVEGMVTQECGAWGWGSAKYVPWEELESKITHGNHGDFCYCDNFVSFWELKWNFDDGDDWDGVPFIRHGRDGHD